MEIAKISSKGQVVIPKQLRELAGLSPGDSVLFRINDNTIILEKIEHPDESMVELLKRGKPFKKDLVKELRDEW